jgi:SPP1 gp7 family putative phage head morphogenesis protein
MPHYPKGIEREFSEMLEFMIERMGDKFLKQAILALNQSTIAKFADAQEGNYAKVFNKLAKQVTRKLLKQFSNEAIEEYCKKSLQKANKFNQRATYSPLEKALGINLQQLVAQEAMSPTINALILETAAWAKRLRDDTLEYFTANTLRAMALGNTIDGVLEEFDISRSKQKEAAKFIARNQVSNFNGILTKLRHQKVGITQGRWRTTEDEKVRVCHQKRNNVVFDLSKGCYSSCDQKWLLPGTDYNCRCIYIAIIPEFEETA